MAKKPANLDMFGNSAEDTPLFSGTSVKARDEVFKAEQTKDQPTLFSVMGNGCRICYDTGEVVILVKNKKKTQLCSCPAGQRLAEQRSQKYYCPSCQCEQCKHLRGENNGTEELSD